MVNPIVSPFLKFNFENVLQSFRFAHTMHPLKYGVKQGIRPIIGPKALSSHYNEIFSLHIRKLNALSDGKKKQSEIS